MIAPDTQTQAGALKTGPRAARPRPGSFGARRRRAVLRDRPPGRFAAILTHPLTLRVLSIAVVCLLWEWAARIPISLAFPTFTATAAAFFSMIADFSLIHAFAITLQPLVVGLVISTVFGVGIGVAMGLNAKVAWFAGPIFIVAQAAPLAALIPLIIFAYGIGLTAESLVVCIIAMPVIVLNSFAAVRHAPTSLIEMGKVFLGSRHQVILRIILPAASPVIFAGLRLGSAAAFVGVVLAELLITPVGIGDLITYNQSTANYPEMYAAILSIIIFSVIFVELIQFIETAVFRPEKRARS